MDGYVGCVWGGEEFDEFLYFLRVVLARRACVVGVRVPLRQHMQGGATARTGAWVRVHGAAPSPHLHTQRLQLCLGLDVCVGGEQPLQSEGARLVVRRVTLGPPLLGTASDRAEEFRVRGRVRGSGRDRVRVRVP